MGVWLGLHAARALYSSFTARVREVEENDEVKCYRTWSIGVPDLAGCILPWEAAEGTNYR